MYRAGRLGHGLQACLGPLGGPQAPGGGIWGKVLHRKMSLEGGTALPSTICLPHYSRRWQSLNQTLIRDSPSCSWMITVWWTGRAQPGFGAIEHLIEQELLRWE